MSRSLILPLKIGTPMSRLGCLLFGSTRLQEPESFEGGDRLMLVKILMRRRFQEGKVKEAFAVIKKIRSIAMNQKGYISGETFIAHDDSRKTMVIGTWQSMDDWMNWKEGATRKKLEGELEQFLEEPTEYEAYVYSKFYLSVSGGGS